MAYTPKTWQCDDTITADELNRMEQGIAEASQGGGDTLVVRVDHTDDSSFPNVNFIYDKTWREVYNAITNGDVVVFPTNNPKARQRQHIAVGVSGDEEQGLYTVICLGVDSQGSVSTMTVYACSADGYLQSQECESSGGGDIG